MYTPGMFRLYQWVNPGSNGQTEELGEYPTLRAAIEAARNIAKVSKLKGRFGAGTTFTPEQKLAHGYDGQSYQIDLEPAYFPHQEITLSNGERVWLEDVDELLRTALVEGIPETLKLLFEAHPTT